jgi:surfactin synthase thioesterase subunit
MTNNTRLNTWIACSHFNPKARLRLFCFPYAGGGASIFHAWVKMLPDEVEVCPIQLPGRENRLKESPLTQLSELLQDLQIALLPILDKPFAFFGHSLGAIISFELARQLRPQDRLTHLFVSGCPAPHLPNLKSPLHKLSDAEFIEAVQQRYQNIPQVVLQEKEVMALFLNILRADLTLFETYSYVANEPLDCPISAFGGLQDKTTSRDQLAAWCEQTSNTFTQRMLPGDHFFLKSAQNPLLQLVSQYLQQALL